MTDIVGAGSRWQQTCCPRVWRFNHAFSQNAQKVGAVETAADFFRQRAGGARPGSIDRLGDVVVASSGKPEPARP